MERLVNGLQGGSGGRGLVTGGGGRWGSVEWKPRSARVHSAGVGGWGLKAHKAVRAVDRMEKEWSGPQPAGLNTLLTLRVVTRCRLQ